MALSILNSSFIPSSETSTKIQQALSKDFWKTLTLFNQVFDIIDVPRNDHPLRIFSQFQIDHKLKSFIKQKDHYTKALALMYSYELRVAENTHYFKENLQHKNKLVRREAMIGVVVFEGWKILDYFFEIEYFISHWQQIRIIEKLKEYPRDPNLSYLKIGLESENPTVKELILRIIHVFKIEDFYGLILKHLVHEIERLKELSYDLSSKIIVPESILMEEENQKILDIYASLKNSAS